MVTMTNKAHKEQHITPEARSVFYDLFPENEAAELEIRSVLLMGLSSWLRDYGMTQSAAAKVLGITQARVSEIKNGKINQFSLDLLVRLASRAGLRPQMRLTMAGAA